MKKRRSVEHADWSISRGDSYKEKCEKILFDRKWELTINDPAVYLNGDLLLHITNPKTSWFEIWSKLKDL